MLVLEDVDLVAMERTMPGMSSNPLLFQLLNEMDGLDEDADVIFVLTTNRVDLLEPALAARPGRIDQAVEIKLPDDECRRRLLERYLRGMQTEVGDLDDVIERTEGVSAAFLKELARRAALVAAEATPPDEAIVVRDADVVAALDDLLEHSTPILRSMLGASPDQAATAYLDPGPGAMPGPFTGGRLGSSRRDVPHHDRLHGRLRARRRVTAERTRGTEGYAEVAAALFEHEASIPFLHDHHEVVHLIPAAPSDVLDIGSGTGRGAPWFAAQRHRVVAAEPVDELRLPAMVRHPSPLIEWVDDSLPRLSELTTRGSKFDVVMLTAVWMHLDEEQRRDAMPRVASLVKPKGVMIMSLRHGPAPPLRRMYDVSAEETVALAADAGLLAVLRLHAASVQKVNQDAGVTWTRLAFENA